MATVIFHAMACFLFPHLLFLARTPKRAALLEAIPRPARGWGA